MSIAQMLALAPMMAFLLAGVAGVAYILGRRSRAPGSPPAATTATRPSTSESVVRELGDISQGVRRRLATHHASILQFRERISQLSASQSEPDWQQLVEEAERVLKPTEELSDEIAQAYNEIRQQTSNVAESGGRFDPLTGLDNRESIEAMIVFLLALKARYDNVFSLVLLDIDHFGDFNAEHGRAAGDKVLRELSAVIKDSMRDTDAAGRFDGEEFVMVLPETGLQGAGVFGERLRERIEGNLPITVSCGLATVADGDTAQTILSRADSALYSAKSAGCNRVFQHTGRNINLVRNQKPADTVARPVEVRSEVAAEPEVPAVNP